MKILKSVIYLLGLLLCITVTISSCSEGDFTIFYQVVNEKAINDTNLENTLSVHNMAEMNLVSGNRYYIAASAIFTREISSSDWDKVSSHTNSGEVMCNSIIEFGTDLYAAFYSRDGKSFGLYSVTNANLDVNPKDITWIEEKDDTDVADMQVSSFKIVNGYLFMSVKNGNVYSYAYTNNGSDYDLVSFNGSTTLSTRIRDVALFEGNYYYLSGTKIYRGSISSVSILGEPPELPEPSEPPPIDDDERYEGIISTDGGHLYVSTSKGNLCCYHNSLGEWRSENFEYITPSGLKKDVWFTKFAEVPDVTIDVVVGSYGSGFYEINEAGHVDDIERFDNTSKSELYAGSIENFFIDSEGRFFVLTMGTGLWRSKCTDGEWETWTWE
jgi:hypothetical protein